MFFSRHFLIRRIKKTPSNTLCWLDITPQAGTYGGCASTCNLFGNDFSKLVDLGLEKLLSCACYWNGVFYGMVDCDNDEDYARATNYLRFSGINYISVRSSLNFLGARHSWIFLDRSFSSGKEAIQFSRQCPGQDKNYSDIGKRLGCPVVRQEYDYCLFTPEIQEKSREYSGGLFKFVSEVINTFVRYREILELRLVKNWLHSDQVSISNLASTTDKIQLGDRVEFSRANKVETGKMVTMTGQVYAKVIRKEFEGYFVVNLERVRGTKDGVGSVFLVRGDHIHSCEHVDPVELLTSDLEKIRRIGLARMSN